MSLARSFGGVAMRVLVDRKVTADRGALAHHRIDPHLAAVQFDKGAHQRQAEPGAAVPRAARAALTPLEYLVFHVWRDTGTAIGHREDDAVLAADAADGDRGIMRRE